MQYFFIEEVLQYSYTFNPLTLDNSVNFSFTLLVLKFISNKISSLIFFSELYHYIHTCHLHFTNTVEN